MLNSGDSSILRVSNFYLFMVFFGIMLPLILEVIAFGLNFIGGITTTSALTILPPLIYYALFFIIFVAAIILSITFLEAMMPFLIALHGIAFLYGIFSILIPALKAFFQCLGGSITCDTTLTFIYAFGMITDILLIVAAFITLFSSFTLAQTIWRRELYTSANEMTYRELTGDTSTAYIDQEQEDDEEEPADEEPNDDITTNGDADEEDETNETDTTISNNSKITSARKMKKMGSSERIRYKTDAPGSSRKGGHTIRYRK